MNYSLKNESIQAYNESNPSSFPKYTSQLINWANQNAQGTRAVVVGQMSDLFPEFMNSSEEINIEEWRKWYVERYPDSFEKATDKIYGQVQNLRNAIPLIDRKMVEKWVEDLVISKTFNGLYLQKAILGSLADKKGLTYRLASPAEESVGIDGFVGDVPYSIKPDTYKTMGRLSEVIDVKMIYYTKKKTSIKIEVED
ncbi:MjaI family restriction endonuclease [Acidaminobacter hydrogenoformans]|uniref:MjaI restriction endonuclease n=1 Tax=Acidaminobacter hydrogenoformans DSM 2784 TaxID=1120920 RepID=A0A1G5S4R3_9FIRM|nr:MjaI family restriction endonuclease [Acidaminobacter hydrogenoformans]SCZ81147.1 MjaI restriction endonuclease [Acidaminobacter hydrogenoformans DSM 2784]